jgi:hypothetical protein
MPTPESSRATAHISSKEHLVMSQPHDPNSTPRPALACLALGILAIAAVPGAGWLWGQFYETVMLCVGIVLLVYFAFVNISAVNGRLTALEKCIADRDRART